MLKRIIYNIIYHEVDIKFYLPNFLFNLLK